MILSTAQIPQIKELKNLKKNYTEISSILNKNGFTDPIGRPLTFRYISKFMIDNGQRLYSINRGKTKYNVNKAKSNFNEIEELLTSNLSPNLKTRVLKELIKDL